MLALGWGGSGELWGALGSLEALWGALGALGGSGGLSLRGLRNFGGWALGARGGSGCVQGEVLCNFTSFQALCRVSWLLPVLRKYPFAEFVLQSPRALDPISLRHFSSFVCLKASRCFGSVANKRQERRTEANNKSQICIICFLLPCVDVTDKRGVSIL